jgi:hypothetical protein
MVITADTNGARLIVKMKVDVDKIKALSPHFLVWHMEVSVKFLPFSLF